MQTFINILALIYTVTAAIGLLHFMYFVWVTRKVTVGMLGLLLYSLLPVFGTLEFLWRFIKFLFINSNKVLISFD